MIDLRVTISERLGGWDLVWDWSRCVGQLRSTRIATAAAAQKSVRRRAKRLALELGSNTVTITWRPTSKVGTMVVRALQ